MRKTTSHFPASSDVSVTVRSLAVSCAAAEDLLRKMLEEWNFSLETLLSAHFVNCATARQALVAPGAGLPSVLLLFRAVEELEEALRTVNSYRYSTDPEYRHRTMFQSNALERVERAKHLHEAAIRALDGPAIRQ